MFKLIRKYLQQRKVKKFLIACELQRLKEDFVYRYLFQSRRKIRPVRRGYERYRRRGNRRGQNRRRGNFQGTVQYRYSRNLAHSRYAFIAFERRLVYGERPYTPVYQRRIQN